MNAYELSELLQRQAASGKRYLEFIKVPSLSVGVYHLPAGGADPQEPHTEDEVYYIVSGQASIRVDDEDRPVKAGSVVFVAAEIEHRFHSIRRFGRPCVFCPSRIFQPKELTDAKCRHIDV